MIKQSKKFQVKVKMIRTTEQERKQKRERIIRAILNNE